MHSIFYEVIFNENITAPKIEITNTANIIYDFFLDDIKNKRNSYHGSKSISLKFENGVNRIIINKLTDRLFMTFNLLISYL